MNKKDLKVWHEDFPKGFSPLNRDSYFIKLLSQQYNILTTPNNPDLLIYSDYGNNNQTYNCKKIYYSQEPGKSKSNYDIAFTSDYIENSNHMRLTYYSVISYQENSFHKIYPNKDNSRRLNFCSFFANVATQTQIDFFKSLSKYKKVFSSGEVLNNTNNRNLSHKDERTYKNYILSKEKPKFLICFENERKIGYTTELIYDAMTNGIIPIYWGNPEIERDFNINSFINTLSFPNLDRVIEYVIFLDKYQNRLNKILEEPWLTETSHQYYFNHSRILDKIEELIEDKNKIYPVNIDFEIEQEIHQENIKETINFKQYKILKEPKQQKPDDIITPNSFFNEIYCLNLNKRHDKWKLVNKRFIREGIFVTRVEGIDKDTIMNDYNQFIRINKNSKLKTPGAFAILKSFLKMFDLAQLNPNIKNILIFEDDVLFDKDFGHKFNTYFQNVPKDWNVIYLAGSERKYTSKETIQKNYNDHFKYARNYDGCFAIAFNINYIKEIYNDLLRLEWPLDSYLNIIKQPNDANKIFVTTEQLCAHDYGKSDNWDIEFTEENISDNWKNRIVDKEKYW